MRLDTDWYESIPKVELEVLFPRLESGGVLIIDDYGHFAGLVLVSESRTDEFFTWRSTVYVWLHRVD